MCNRPHQLKQIHYSGNVMFKLSPMSAGRCMVAVLWWTNALPRQGQTTFWWDNKKGPRISKQIDKTFQIHWVFNPQEILFHKMDIYSKFNMTGMSTKSFYFNPFILSKNKCISYLPQYCHYYMCVWLITLDIWNLNICVKTFINLIIIIYISK